MTRSYTRGFCPFVSTPVNRNVFYLVTVSTFLLTVRVLAS